VAAILCSGSGCYKVPAPISCCFSTRRSCSNVGHALNCLYPDLSTVWQQVDEIHVVPACHSELLAELEVSWASVCAFMLALPAVQAQLHCPRAAIRGC
jgi:hypothetical protein